MTDTTKTAPTDMTNVPPGGLAVTITAQYIKDLSFECPGAPQIFGLMQKPPEMSMGVNIETRGINGAPQGQACEVALALKLDAKLDGKQAFIAELVYAGVFVLPEMPEEQLRLFLLVEAPRLLFPFARNVLSNTVREGGFPYVTINPIDFLSLYVANQGNIGAMSTAGAA